jgi:hypothetical protein
VFVVHVFEEDDDETTKMIPVVENGARVARGGLQGRNSPIVA